MAKKKIFVTPAQTDAARMVVARSAVTGRHVSPSVSKIAEAAAHPAKTVAETSPTHVGVSSSSSGRGGTIRSAARSAVTGKFVTKRPSPGSASKSR